MDSSTFWKGTNITHATGLTQGNLSVSRWVKKTPGPFCEVFTVEGVLYKAVKSESLDTVLSTCTVYLLRAQLLDSTFYQATLASQGPHCVYDEFLLCVVTVQVQRVKWSFYRVYSHKTPTSFNALVHCSLQPPPGSWYNTTRYIVIFMMQQLWTVSHHFYDIYNNKQKDTKVKYWKRTRKTCPFPFSTVILPAGGLIKDTREEKQTKISPLRHNFAR